MIINYGAYRLSEPPVRLKLGHEDNKNDMADALVSGNPNLIRDFRQCSLI